VFVDGLLAMWVAPWGPAAMEYAERLVYLPMGLVGNAFATVMLPAFSSHATESDAASGIGSTLERALRNIAVIMAPMAVGLTILALPIVNLIYCWKSGRFDADSARFTARALAGYAPGLLVFSFQKAVTPAFYALQDTRTPMRISVVGVVLNFCLNVLFVLTWKEGWQHMGIAVATVITSVINSAMLAWILYRRLGISGFSGFAGTYIRSIAVALIMGLAALWIHGRVFALGAADSKIWQLLALGAAIAGGAILYIVLATIFCRSAVRELVGDLRHRKKV
jgi:putative peptidoglycan lipid II flippase